MEIIKHQGKKPVTAYEYFDNYSLQLTEEEFILLLFVLDRPNSAARAVLPNAPVEQAKLQNLLANFWKLAATNHSKVYDKFHKLRDAIFRINRDPRFYNGGPKC